MSHAATDRFTQEALTAARDAIRDAGGNEVFLLGTLDEQRLVAGVRVVARGNRQAVPALLQIPRPGEVVIHNHPSGQLTPSDADLDIAARLGNDGIGAFIVDNDVERVYVVVEPHRPATAAALDGARTDAILAPGGGVAAQLPGYEHRPQQLRMLQAVVAAFNDDAALVVEAGTGTGKSLAYLIPAVSWALQNRERVVIATHTIHLQEQLIRKDLPLLTEKVGLRSSAVLVKGRGNYVCRRKAQQAEQQGDRLIADDLSRELKDLLAWIRTTSDGSLSDLPVKPRPEVWEQVVSESDNCLRVRCPFYSECFFYSARRAAAQADIIVVNHHLLLADLALRDELDSYTQNAILPPARRIIIDEAHHLEDVATSYFGLTVSLAAIDRLFGRLQSARADHKGVLPTLLVALESIDDPGDQVIAEGALRQLEERLLPGRRSLLEEARQRFAEFVEQVERRQGKELILGRDEKIRVTSALRQHPFWSTIETSLRRLGTAFLDYAGEFDSVLERLGSFGSEGEKRTLSLATEVRALRGRIAGIGRAMHEFAKESDDDCKWIEARHRPRFGKSITFHAAPIRVAPRLREALFDPFPTVVLTSATLAVGGSFAFLEDRVGLAALDPPERRRQLRVESPFDFAGQALLAVPRDLPEPNAPGHDAAIHDAIRRITLAAEGGTFVLFTSYVALQRAAEAVMHDLRRAGLTVLRQGEANRQLLLDRFVADRRSVLFATDSFWEGVDVRGDALRCVVITKLPFRVPTEPIEQARVEEIERRGGNPFAEHALPQAVIKLKQGFGRLIRSRTDRGAVVLLDSRVVRKGYGRTFLESLPPARRLIADATTVWREVDGFFASMRRTDSTQRRGDAESR